MKRRSDTHETEAAKKVKMEERLQIKKELAEEKNEEQVQNAPMQNAPAAENVPAAENAPAAENTILPPQHGVMAQQNTVPLPQQNTVPLPQQNTVPLPQQNPVPLPQPAIPPSPQDILNHHHEWYMHYCMQAHHLAQWWNMMQATHHQRLQFLQRHIHYHGQQAWYQTNQLSAGVFTPNTGHPSWFQKS